MKKLLMSTAILLAASGSAFAQNYTGKSVAKSDSVAVSGSTADAVSGSYANTGSSNSQVYIDARTPGTIRSEGVLRTEQSGTVTNKFAPAVAAPAMGSGHPCGLGNSLGISIIGGGVTGGATRVDDACLLAQMGYTPAAMQMIAARNPSACKALVSSGAISARSYCGDDEGRARVRGPGVYKQPALAPLAGAPVAPVEAPKLTCGLKEGTQRVIITNWPDRQACARQLGLL